MVFAIHWCESAMGVHVSPILNHPLHLPPHRIPQGCPSAPALSTLSHALNLDWRSISHMVIVILFCHSKSSVKFAESKCLVSIVFERIKKGTYSLGIFLGVAFYNLCCCTFSSTWNNSSTDLLLPTQQLKGSSFLCNANLKWVCKNTGSEDTLHCMYVSF